MSTFIYEGGGGQKSPKNCPRGLCMPPYLNCILFLIMIFVILEEKISAYASRHFSQDLFLKGLKLKQAKNGPHRPPNIII